MWAVFERDFESLHDVFEVEKSTTRTADLSFRDLRFHRRHFFDEHQTVQQTKNVQCCAHRVNTVETDLPKSNSGQSRTNSHAHWTQQVDYADPKCFEVFLEETGNGKS